MVAHYSQPKGFVGRNICYAVYYDSTYYGHIVWGSATRHLKGRHEYLGTDAADLNSIINNVFYNISKVRDAYPLRNFTSKVLRSSMDLVKVEGPNRYGDTVKGFETLVEKPRTGELYLRAGFEKVGETIGYTCKRVGGFPSSDSWSGKRIWSTDKETLRPKIVLCKRV